MACAAAFRVVLKGQFAMSDVRDICETSLIAQLNQPPAARPTALLLSCISKFIPRSHRLPLDLCHSSFAASCSVRHVVQMHHCHVRFAAQLQRDCTRLAGKRQVSR
jgi:hypothetical protein